MKRERRTLIWCPSCKQDWYELIETPDPDREGFWRNTRRFLRGSQPPDDHRYCPACKLVLERRRDA